VVVPGKLGKDLPVGTERSILKQLYVDVLRERGEDVPQPRAIEAVTLPAA
jgi:hypothetical protein